MSRFSEVRLGARGADVAAPPARPVLRPPMAAPAAAPALPVGLDGAMARVRRYLSGRGFALESRPDGAGELVTATRMGPPSLLAGEAVCALQAMHRPDISSTDLTVRLEPTSGGVLVEPDARFVEIDTRLIAGTLSRQTCRSRGVLEGSVRRAALGG